MFASLMQSIEADIFVFVDGDGTYDPRSSREAIWRLQKNDLDCVFVNRKKQALWHQKQYGRFLGNVLFYALFRLFTRLSLKDPLTG